MSVSFNDQIYMNQSLSSGQPLSSPSSSSQTLSQYNNYSTKYNTLEKTHKIKKQSQKKEKKTILGGISSTYDEEQSSDEEELIQKQCTLQVLRDQYSVCKTSPQFQYRQCIIKDPLPQHKYLILPNILIDFDSLKEGDFTQDLTSLRQFRPTACVNYLKNMDMVEMEVGINGNAIRQFSFICDMLDSLGDDKAHKLSMALRRYDQIISECEQKKKNMAEQSAMKQSPNNDKCSPDFHNSSQFTFDGNNGSADSGWTFEQSRQKAYKIIYNIASNSPSSYKYMYFRLLRGSKDTCEFFSQINSREYLSFILGTSNIQQIVQVILRNGMLNKKSNVDTFQCINYSGEQYMYDTYKAETSNISQNYDMSVENTTINDSTYQMDISFTKIQLSNYKDKFNDYLLVISPKKYDNNFMFSLLLKRLEEQKNTPQVQQTSNFMDISYQAQSEVFLEKYYSDKIKNQHA